MLNCTASIVVVMMSYSKLWWTCSSILNKFEFFPDGPANYQSDQHTCNPLTVLPVPFQFISFTIEFIYIKISPDDDVSIKM